MLSEMSVVVRPLHACGERLREMDGSLKPGDGWKMEVTDADGKAIFALRFTTEAASE